MENLVILAVLIWFAAGLLAWLAKRFSNWQKSWKKCPHGVAGGQEQKLCSVCFREEQEAIKQRELLLQLEQRSRKRHAEAEALRHLEAARLYRSIIPRLDELRALTPQGFEDYVADIFRRLGFDVEPTPYSNDHGRDGLLRKDGELILYECKRYDNTSLSGRPDLQKFHSAIVTDNAKGGIFITTGSFTKDAVEFARTHPIELIDGVQLIKKLFESFSKDSEDDHYHSMCRECGAIATHRLRTPEPATCANGHAIQPTLTIDEVLGISKDAIPTCINCGVSMVLRKKTGRKPFWGCPNYHTTKCTYTLRCQHSDHIDRLPVSRASRKRRRVNHWSEHA